MNSYWVVWEIDIDADTPREAAEIARQKQQFPRPDYWCGVFNVTDEHGETTRIDLDDFDDLEGEDAEV